MERVVWALLLSTFTSAASYSISTTSASTNWSTSTSPTSPSSLNGGLSFNRTTSLSTNRDSSIGPTTSTAIQSDTSVSRSASSSTSTGTSNSERSTATTKGAVSASRSTSFPVSKDISNSNASSTPPDGSPIVSRTTSISGDGKTSIHQTASAITDRSVSVNRTTSALHKTGIPVNRTNSAIILGGASANRTTPIAANATSVDPRKAANFIDCESYSSAHHLTLIPFPDPTPSANPATVPFEEYWCAHWAFRWATAPEAYPGPGGGDPYFYNLTESERSFCMSVEKANYSSWAAASPPLSTVQGSYSYTHENLWFPHVTPPCCPTACDLSATAAQLLYWPTPAPEPKVTSFVSDGKTFISPTVYVIFKDIAATNGCGPIGPQHTTVTMGVDPSHVKSYGINNDGEQLKTIDFADLWSNCTGTEADLAEYPIDPPACNTQANWNGSSCQAQYSTYLSSYDQDRIHCHPYISYPPGLLEVDPAWTTCANWPEGGHSVVLFDPPRTLGPATAMVPAPTQQNPKGPGNALPGSSVMDPGPAKTASPELSLTKGPDEKPSNSEPPPLKSDPSAVAPDLDPSSPESPKNTQNEAPPKESPADPNPSSNDPNRAPTEPETPNNNPNEAPPDRNTGNPSHLPSNYPADSRISEGANPPDGNSMNPESSKDPVPLNPAYDNSPSTESLATLPSQQFPAQPSSPSSPVNAPFNDPSKPKSPSEPNNDLAAAPSPFTTIVQGHEIYIPASPGVLHIDGQSLTPGSEPALISGTSIVVQPNGDLILGQSTVRNIYPTPPPAPAASTFSVGTEILTLSSNNVIAAGTTMQPKGPALTIAGTPVSLGPSALHVGASTIPFVVPGAFTAPAPLVTVAGQAYPITQASNGLQIAGSTLHVDEPAITISGTPIQALGSTAIKIGTNTVPLNPALSLPGSQDIKITVAGQAHIVSQISNGIVIAGSTIQPGQPGITISGTPVQVLGSTAILIGTNTIPVSPALPSPGFEALKVTAAGQAYPVSQVSDGIVIAGSTIQPDQPGITISGTPIQALGTSALIIGSSTIALSPKSPPNVLTATAGGQTYPLTQLPNVNGILIAGSTLHPGESMTISGTPIRALGSTGIVIGSNTIAIPSPTSTPIVTATAGGQTYPLTQLRSHNAILIAGSTLHPGESMTISGTPIRALGSTGIVIGSNTIAIPSPTSTPTPIHTAAAGDHTYLLTQLPSNNGILIADSTLHPDGPALTISDTPIRELGTTAVVIGDSTIPLQSLPTSKGEQGIGDLISAGLNGGPAQSSITGSASATDSSNGGNTASASADPAPIEESGDARPTSGTRRRADIEWLMLLVATVMGMFALML